MRASFIATLLAFLACSQAAHQPSLTEATLGQGLLASDYGFSNLAAGNNNDWSSSTCFWNSGVCQVVGHASGSNITGLDKAVFFDHGVIVWLMNRGSTTIVVKNNDSNSSTNNRVHTRSGTDILVAPGRDQALIPIVDWSTNPPTDQGWIDLSFNAVQDVATSTPSRSLGTAFQPSTTRPVLATYSASSQCVVSISGGEEGRVELLSDSSNPPTTIRGELSGCKATGTVVIGVSLTTAVRGSASYLVPPNDFVLIRSVTVTGAPTFSLNRQVEQTL